MTSLFNLFGVNSIFKDISPKITELNIIGIGYIGGQPHKGVELAPQVLRENNLIFEISKLNYKIQDHGDTIISESENIHTSIYNIWKSSYEQTKKMAELRQFILTIGGDHSINIGIIPALVSKYDDLKLIWVDAHTDINTNKTSPSGNLHGMPVAHILNLMPSDFIEHYMNPHNIVYIGIRDMDPGEIEIVDKLKIKKFTMFDIDKYGISKIMDQVFEYLGLNSQKYPLYLSFDIDALDPSVIKNTGTPVIGGLSFREAKFICKSISDKKCLVGMDLVEFNPILGTKEQSTETAKICIDLIKTALE